mgnify:FL=1
MNPTLFHFSLLTFRLGIADNEACKMHIGNLIQEELKRQGRSVTWFAEQLFYTRPHIYKIFSKATIDTGLLQRISRILNHDFFQDLSNDDNTQQV